jgi:hypothetical protein
MVESDTFKLARLKPDANPLLADALLSVWVDLLNIIGFTVNLGVGKKKYTKAGEEKILCWAEKN